MTSSATHALLPLLSRDESIRLHLAAGRLEHRRLFGRDAVGCWLPECGYRPRGRWAPGFDAPAGVRRGIDEHLADAGFRWFVADAHQAGAGPAPGVWSGPQDGDLPRPAGGNPYRVRLAATVRGAPEVAVFIRDPIGSRLVWDRQTGYPGDPAHLEFHRQSEVDGLRYWAIGRRETPLDRRDWYRPDAAAARASVQASHLLGALERIAVGSDVEGIVLPFDAELFGHWWAEGDAFLDGLWDGLRDSGAITADTPSRFLARRGTPERIRLAVGSWGAGGDFHFWLNDATAWMWHQVWALEQLFWDAAPAAISDTALHPLLAQAAREMLLAQASDWPFHVSGATATDYAERRFSEHATNARILAAALRPDAPDREGAVRFAQDLRRRDDIFPDILPAIHAALAGSRAMHL
jgi:1,4-alpha-glucan branching enzyme